MVRAAIGLDQIPLDPPFFGWSKNGRIRHRWIPHTLKDFPPVFRTVFKFDIKLMWAADLKGFWNAANYLKNLRIARGIIEQAAKWDRLQVLLDMRIAEQDRADRRNIRSMITRRSILQTLSPTYPLLGVTNQPRRSSPDIALGSPLPDGTYGLWRTADNISGGVKLQEEVINCPRFGMQKYFLHVREPYPLRGRLEHSNWIDPFPNVTRLLNDLPTIPDSFAEAYPVRGRFEHSNWIDPFPNVTGLLHDSQDYFATISDSSVLAYTDRYVPLVLTDSSDFSDCIIWIGASDIIEILPSVINLCAITI